MANVLWVELDLINEHVACDWKWPKVRGLQWKEKSAINQTSHCLLCFPKKFGDKHPMYYSFQSSWFKKWPWIHYDQTSEKRFVSCVQRPKVGNFRVCASKGEDAFVTRGYTNWKDVSGNKREGFMTHEHSQFHKYCVDLTMKTHEKDVGELLSSQHEKEKETNRAYLCKVLENIIFLARQQLPIRGNWESPDDSKDGGCEQHQISTSYCYYVQRTILF